MSEPDGFLARWSRRKHEARREEPAAPVDPPRTAEPEAPVAEPEPPPLPPIESITAETDISVFLAKGVADSIRNAALRRMWSLDPAIRDYVGDARDYAYDWNVPGGVPGFGAIEPGYDVEGTIARMLGRQEPETGTGMPDEPPAEVAANADPAPPEAVQSVPRLREEDAPRASSGGRGEGALPEEPRSKPPPHPPSGSLGLPCSDNEALPESLDEGAPGEQGRRVNTPRHGRATPI